ncbi:MAG: hypothetical protein IMX00_08165 [Limnochordales bacterium]|nr:hypothetical protein [Limnochordales bacterium]
MLSEYGGPAAAWDRWYREAIAEGVRRVRELPGVVLGFHSTIDGLKKVEAGSLKEWLGSLPGLAEQVAELLAADASGTPRVAALREIRSPAELLAALLDCMARGKARQLMIRSEETFRWALQHVGYDRLRMGGTSGNMANALAPLGYPRVVVYAHPLSVQLAELFVDRPNLFVLASGELIPPRVAAARQSGSKIRALHWVFEFEREQRFTYPRLDGGLLRWEEGRTPRANRFIAAWNPENNQLRVNPDFVDSLLQVGSGFTHFIVSGFHILSETYPDGSTYRECLQGVGAVLEKVRGRYPHLLLHYEFASIASPLIRRGVVEEILPRVDSLGLNEVELIAILRDLGEEQLAAGLEAADAAAGRAAAAGEVATPPLEILLPALVRVAEAGRLRRIHLHNLGYYLCLVRPDQEGQVGDEWQAGKLTRSGLLFAAALAAVRAVQGDLTDPGQAQAALEVPLSPVGLRGVEQLERLAAAGMVRSDGAAMSGIFSFQSWQGVFVPTRVVSRPLFTVGLGDVISATAFLTGTNPR